MVNYKGDLIVSRYREDTTWLSEFSDYRIFLYNKGEPIEGSINLPNVGRCDHTYLYHIVTNYNNLADNTVFFPGSIDSNELKKKNAINILRNILYIF